MAEELGQELIDELESYLSETDVQMVMQTMMQELFRSRPKDPIAFFMEYILEHHRSSAESVLEPAQLRTDDDHKVVLHLSSEEDRKYLEDHGTPKLLADIAGRLCERKPENTLAEIVAIATELQQAADGARACDDPNASDLLDDDAEEFFEEDGPEP